MDAILKLKAEQLAREMATQAQTLDDLNGLMRTLMKSALERMLDTEMDVHLGRKAIAALPDRRRRADPRLDRAPKNRRNGHSQKTVRGDLGELTLDTPRDRNGTFEPQLIAKHQRRLAGFDEKILALYAKGMTTRDIQDVVKELYGVEVSPTLVSEITADLDAEVTAWRQRRLDAVWPIVYLDGIVVHVRGENGRVSQHTMYVAHRRESAGEEGASGPVAERDRRGEVLAVVPDGPEESRPERHLRRLRRWPDRLPRGDPHGLPADEGAAVHRAPGAGGLKYVTDKDSRRGGGRPEDDLPVGDGAEAEQALEKFAEVWGEKYPTIVKQWRLKWTRHHRAVRLPAGDPQGDLHDQRDRVGQQRDPEVHAEPQAVPERGVGVEAGVPGDPRGVEEVDDADRGLEGGLEPLRHRVRGPPAARRQELSSKPVPTQLTQNNFTGPRRAIKPNPSPAYFFRFITISRCPSPCVVLNSVGRSLPAAAKQTL